MSCLPCESSYSLGCFQHCATIPLPVSDETGKHVLTYNFGCSKKAIDVVMTAGVVFDQPNVFNETAKICFQITKPSGNALTLTDAGTVYSCFCFQNMI